jgi:hypothetical protein
MPVAVMAGEVRFDAPSAVGALLDGGIVNDLQGKSNLVAAI